MYLVWAIAPTDGDASRNYAKHTAVGAGRVSTSSNNLFWQPTRWSFFAGGNSTAPPPSITPPSGGDDPKGPTYNSPNGDFRLTWQIIDDIIVFKMEGLQSWLALMLNLVIRCLGKTNGWISIGVSNQPKMSEAGLVRSFSQHLLRFLFCRYVHWLGGWFKQRHSVRHLFSQFRNASNWYCKRWPQWQHLVLCRPEWRYRDIHPAQSSLNKCQGWTSITFARKLDTGDSSNDFAIKDEDQYLLWAYAPSDGNGDFYAKHTAWGAEKVNFFQGTVEANVIRSWNQWNHLIN